MKKNRSLNRKGILVLVFVLILTGVLILGMISIRNAFVDSKPSVQDTDAEMMEGNQTKPQEPEDKSSLEVALADYVVYDLDDLDFRFVIARLRIRNEEPVRLSLSHLVTDEGIVLNEVSSYVDRLEQKGYFLGKQNVWFEIISQENTVLSNVFIPVTNPDAQTVTVSLDFSDQQLMMDLTNPQGKAESLQYAPDDIISDGKTYQMRVSDAFEITGDSITRTFEDGTVREYSPSSTAEIHAFNVEAVSLWGDQIVIEKAVYIDDTTGEEFEAFNEQFSTMKYQNLINHPITDKDSGVLFFETLNPEQSPITYQGTLVLTIRDQPNPIRIQVAL